VTYDTLLTLSSASCRCNPSCALACVPTVSQSLVCFGLCAYCIPIPRVLWLVCLLYPNQHLSCFLLFATHLYCLCDHMARIDQTLTHTYTHTHTHTHIHIHTLILQPSVARFENVPLDVTAFEGERIAGTTHTLLPPLPLPTSTSTTTKSTTLWFSDYPNHFNQCDLRADTDDTENQHNHTLLLPRPPPFRLYRPHQHF
jgi:hypothetical protein